MDETGQTPPSAPQVPPAAPETSAYGPPPIWREPGQLPTPEKRSRSGWKVFAVVVGVLALSAAACCGLILTLFPSTSMTLGDSVAVIHLDGVIAGTGSEFEGIITPEAMLGKLNQAVEDASVKAIVLRIDSPGGTVAASQEISTEIARAAEIKPIVASIGDVGASGAYMAASQCDEIVANPTSAVGSIGVITEIPNVAGLLEKLGVEFTVLTAGEYKDAGSPWRSVSPTETDLIQREVDIAYEEFIRIVAEGRGLPEDDVREMATGWAWSAIEAKDMGLVDTLGTYSDALDRAADLGGIEGDYNVISYDEYGFEDLFGSFLGVIDRFGPTDVLDDTGGRLAPAVPR